MKAKDWKFDKYLPDVEDMEAQHKALDMYFSLPIINGLNQAERESEAFCAGFFRGVAWCLAKSRADATSNLATHTSKIFDKESLPYQLAEALISKVSQRRRTYNRRLATEAGKEKLIQDNAYSFDLLLRKDKKNINEVLEVLTWSQEEDFWKNNILSAAKFRLQYDRLLSQMRAKGIGSLAPDPNSDFTKKLIDVYKMLIRNDNFIPTPLQHRKFVDASAMAVKFFTEKGLENQDPWPDYILHCLGKNYVERGEVVYPGHFCSEHTWQILIPQYLAEVGLI